MINTTNYKIKHHTIFGIPSLDPWVIIYQPAEVFMGHTYVQKYKITYMTPLGSRSMSDTAYLYLADYVQNDMVDDLQRFAAKLHDAIKLIPHYVPVTKNPYKLNNDVLRLLDHLRSYYGSPIWR